ncbi:TIR domain-containing protein [Streptomyces sp. NPDC001851]|uniref:TIR domain-containing protein n=1 Tax=Streptomyces sp. NPDC001851 TaxID=3154529 RepID=UPI00332682E2
MTDDTTGAGTGSGNSSHYGSGNTFGSGNSFVNGNGNSTNSGTQNLYGGGSRPPADDDRPGPSQDRPGPSRDRSRNVFVVHGRDEEVRTKMFGLLRKLDLRPLEWEDLVRATGKTAPFLGEVVAKAPEQAQAALVLLTPDDIVQLHPELRGSNEPPYETEPTGQPRPNVLIELGMVLMAYPERTLMVEVGELRTIADIAGRNVIRFDGSEAALSKIVQRLRMAGCTIDDTRSEWRQTWPYSHLSAYGRTGRHLPPAR